MLSAQLIIPRGLLTLFLLFIYLQYKRKRYYAVMALALPALGYALYLSYPIQYISTLHGNIIDFFLLPYRCLLELDLLCFFLKLMEWGMVALAVTLLVKAFRLRSQSKEEGLSWLPAPCGLIDANHPAKNCGPPQCGRIEVGHPNKPEGTPLNSLCMFCGHYSKSFQTDNGRVYKRCEHCGKSYFVFVLAVVLLMLPYHISSGALASLVGNDWKIRGEGAGIDFLVWLLLHFSLIIIFFLCQIASKRLRMPRLLFLNLGMTFIIWSLLMILLALVDPNDSGRGLTFFEQFHMFFVILALGIGMYLYSIPFLCQAKQHTITPDMLEGDGTPKPQGAD